ncbi:MAG: putative HTH-type transcriptional regulator YfiR [Actinobacteria bacterium ADurb.Bin444]|nr:MAG: putative HTH-type transcriptional regulator YfiR [Actinobacteria bacterium ADurb.Bin444]
MSARPVEERREAIVSAAQELILKNGYSHTTLGQVAVRAGVSKGLISYYFAKKDELFLAVLERILGRLRRDLEGCCKGDRPAWEQVQLNLKNLFGSERRTRSYYTVLIDFLAQAPRERSVRDYTRVIYQTHLTYMERTVESGVKSGEFRPVEPHAAASMLVAMMEGLILQWLYNPERLSLADGYQLCERFARELFFEDTAFVRVDVAVSERK